MAVARPEAAALIRLLAWELPYAVGVALKKKVRRRKSNRKLDEELEEANHKRRNLNV